LGSNFASSLREISFSAYRDLFQTYGYKSSLYAEMVFGNMVNVKRLTGEYPQSPIFAMRLSKALPALDITARTGLKLDEVKRFNPALDPASPGAGKPVSAFYVQAFGTDVSFWHRPPTPEYAAALNDFLHVEGGYRAVARGIIRDHAARFQDRFEATRTEEGSVMATTLAYVISDLRTSRRAAILEEFRTSGRILDLFKRGVDELGLTIRGSRAVRSASITVHDPRGYPRRFVGKRLAPRLSSLDGKTVYLVDCLFDNTDVFIEQLAAVVRRASACREHAHCTAEGDVVGRCADARGDRGGRRRRHLRRRSLKHL
jgi:hypothetical protein